MPHAVSAQSFKDMEQSGWHAKAASYEDLFGPITRDAMEPLLDAAGIKAESSVLDVGSGPCYGAAAAAAPRLIVEPRSAHGVIEQPNRGTGFQHACPAILVEPS